MPPPDLGRLNWNCFSLLAGTTPPLDTGAAEATKNRQNNSAKAETSHFGYIAKERGGLELGGKEIETCRWDGSPIYISSL